MAETPFDKAPGTPRWVIALLIGIVVIAVVVVAAMVLSGGQHGPGLHTAAASPIVEGSASVVTVVGRPAAMTDSARTIKVEARDTLAFEPGSLRVASGEIVTFEVTNNGQTPHEFTLGDGAMQQEHAAAMEHMPAGLSHELPNSIRVDPGATKTLTWQFGDAGVLEYACHEPGHYAAGMLGQVTVE